MNKMRCAIKVFLFSILIMQFNVLLAQSCYNDYDANEKKIFFSENFDNNSKKWFLDNDWLKGKIADGIYTLTCKNFKNSTGLSYINTGFDESKDYEIETRIKLNKGSGAFVFGLSDKFDHFRIEITENSEILIINNCITLKTVVNIYNKKSEVIKLNDFNKITIRKEKTKYTIFVNEVLIKELTDIKLFGDKIGFSVGWNSEILIDDMSISYLQLNPPKISWIFPKENEITNNDSIQISASIESKTELKAIFLYKNKTSYLVTDYAKKDPDKFKYDLQYTIKLKEGENEVYIEAVTFESKSKSDIKNIIWNSLKIPLFEWISPVTNNLTVKNEVFQCKGIVKTEKPLTSAQIVINSNQPVNIIDSVISGNLSYTVKLQKGVNMICFILTNSTGRTTSKIYNIIYSVAQLPFITWIAPSKNNYNSDTANYTIKACINSVSEINTTEIFVNGTILSDDRAFKPIKSKDCSLVIERNITLIQGINSFYITALNKEGKTTSETRYINFDPKVIKTEKRLALVIGNSNYSGATKLKNPVNDANLMKATLIDLGFDVIIRTDASKEEMEKAIREFSKKLPDYQVALFYYAGHGIQIDGENFLIPIDAVLNDKNDCKWEAIKVNTAVEEFEKYSENTNIVILDACRNNPFRAWTRGTENGFKAISPVSGTIISFATSEGSVAADGAGENGLFTEELVKQMNIPQPIESVFKKTRIQVEKRTKNAQSPQEWSKLKGDFYFKK